MLQMRFLSDSYRTQTCNLLIRSQMLYSIELRSRVVFRPYSSAFLVAMPFSLMRAFLPARLRR